MFILETLIEINEERGYRTISKSWWNRIYQTCTEHPNTNWDWTSRARDIAVVGNGKLLPVDFNSHPGFKIGFETEEDATAFVLRWS